MKFKKHGPALLPDELPHLRTQEIDPEEVKREIKRTRSAFARYTTETQTLSPTTSKCDDFPKEWWFCLRDTPIFLDQLTAKQRYRIRRGLKNNSVVIADDREIANRIDEIVDVHIKSLEEYPDVYRHVPTADEAKREILKITGLSHCDMWLCIDTSTDKVSAYAYCFRQEDIEHLSSVKCHPDFLNNDVNAALAFKIVEHYINNLNLRYISDGERNIRHISNYQDFLVRVIGFRYAYCKLHVIYHPYLKPVVDFLYMFRGLIDKLSHRSPQLYNLSCMLKQESIARQFRH